MARYAGQMRIPIFGRKPATPTPPATEAAAPDDRAASPGHAAVLAHLRQIETAEPLARAQLAGRVLFDLVYQMISNERGARIEDMIGILASTGGFASLLAALDEAERSNLALGPELTIVETTNGERYFFGDLPNRYLIESREALLSLALGAAQACGGDISMEMVHDAMRRVAGNIGGEGFGVPDLPAAHEPGDLPINYIRHLWPRILEALDLYEVPAGQRPAAIGFALQHAIEGGKDALDPTIAARIAVECAVPMAKIDPRRVR